MKIEKALRLWAVLCAGLLFSGVASAQTRELVAGPIWNQNHANRRCPEVCTAQRASWNGQWRTIVPGQQSVCGCVSAPTAPSGVAEVPAGPIWNNRLANRRCPQVCASRRASWTGQWRTTIPGRMSVCACALGGHPAPPPVVVAPPPPPVVVAPPPVIAPSGARNINAGPIWNQNHANRRCPQVCASQRASWNGEWRTTIPGRMSVCACVGGGFAPPPPVVAPVAQDVPAGPIWNQNHANRRCPRVCASQRASWNGQWRTTVPGQMSVCGCLFRR